MILYEGTIIPIIGITLGFLVMRIFNEPMYGISTATYGLVGGAYLAGTIIGLLVAIRNVINKKPLELLQVKE